MKNLRISSKLFTAFGALGAVLLCLVAFALFQMNEMNSRARDIALNRMVKVSIADDVSTGLAKFRAVEMLHVMTTDVVAMDRLAARKDAVRAILDSNLIKLDQILVAPQARAYLADIRRIWPTYLREDARVGALSRANRNEEAAAQLGGSMLERFDTMTKTADSLSEFQLKLGLDAAAANNSAYERARTLMMVATLAAFGGAIAVLVLLVRQIARPLSVMTSAMGELAAGNMEAKVPSDDRRDEVGDLAKAMASFRDQLAEAERAKAEQTALICGSIGKGLSGLAEGDLVSRVESDLTGPFAKLKNDFNHAAATLQATMAQVAAAALGINNGAGDIRQASEDLAQRTEQQAASLEETAAAMDEITATVKSTAQRAGSANVAVQGVQQVAQQSGEVVRHAVEAMGGIERASSEISEIITVIDGIAFQTNLLALNAGVEAARAGDAGKGFAVVASEVRALAQRSAEAAKDVKTRITASSEQVSEGVRLVGETGDALIQIIARIGEISHLVADITAAAEQQAAGLQQVNTAVSEMDSVTQQNAAMGEQANAAVTSLVSEADGLAERMARFRIGAVESAAPSAAPVHQLQRRAASAARKIAPAAPRSIGNAALAQDEWSDF